MLVRSHLVQCVSSSFMDKNHCMGWVVEGWQGRASLKYRFSSSTQTHWTRISRERTWGSLFVISTLGNSYQQVSLGNIEIKRSTQLGSFSKSTSLWALEAVSLPLSSKRQGRSFSYWGNFCQRVYPTGRDQRGLRNKGITKGIMNQANNQVPEPDSSLTWINMII